MGLLLLLVALILGFGMPAHTVKHPAARMVRPQGMIVVGTRRVVGVALPTQLGPAETVVARPGDVATIRIPAKPVGVFVERFGCERVVARPALRGSTFRVPRLPDAIYAVRVEGAGRRAFFTVAISRSAPRATATVSRC